MNDQTEQQPQQGQLSQEALEQLKRDYEELETEAKYIFPDPAR